MARFKRVLIKLSGEALAAPDGYWLYPQVLNTLAADIAQASKDGIEIAVVIGGGNIIRGARVSSAGWIDRATADSMGMLATAMNSIALENAVNAAGVTARAPCRRSPCRPFARPTPASRRCTTWSAAMS